MYKVASALRRTDIGSLPSFDDFLAVEVYKRIRHGTLQVESLSEACTQSFLKFMMKSCVTSWLC